MLQKDNVTKIQSNRYFTKKGQNQIIDNCFSEEIIKVVGSLGFAPRGQRMC